MSLLREFYQDPYLHVKMLSGSLLVSGGLVFALYHLRTPEFFEFHFQIWHLLLIPLGIYVGGMSVIFIHNATHNCFPTRWFNRFCGHIAGMQQLWGFMGWKLIHILHHQYTDDADKDIHSPKGMTFGQYVLKMFFFPSQVINQRYFEHFGHTPKYINIKRFSFFLFLCLVFTNLAFWYLLLGPEGMLFFYIPSFIMGYFVFSSLNYYGHPVDPATGETHAINIDKGWYWVGNRLWFGIYFHENHHKKPQLFNPRYMPVKSA